MTSSAPVPRRITPPRQSEAIYVAGRGVGVNDGLHRWAPSSDGWRGTHLATVSELAALAAHPSLSVLYGVSGAAEGRIHAWDVTKKRARTLGVIASGGREPCHVVVDPLGRLLVATNYGSGSLTVQKLAADGSFWGTPSLIQLTGASVDPDRQRDSHPHQAVFVGMGLVVVDLGSDLIREFDIDPFNTGPAVLVPTRSTAVPAGTGPRHLAQLANSRVVLSGEIGSTVLTGTLGTDKWMEIPSTARTGLGGSRNYAGDIQASLDGRLAYVANRGHDTVSVIGLDGAAPQLLAESAAGVAWPQHLLVHNNELLVAGSKSSQVAALPLVDGMLGTAQVIFECAGAAWLLADRF